MSVTKYIPLALIAGGFVALWRLNKGLQASLPTAMPVNGLAPYPAPSVVSGLGHGHGHGHHGGGFRGGWAGGYGPSWTAYEADAGTTVADAFVDAQGNLVVGVPRDPKTPRVKVLLNATGTVIRTLSGLGDLGFGFKSVVKAVSQTVTTPVKVAAAPLRLAVAVPLAVGAGVKSGSWSGATDSLRKSAISPISSITKGTTRFQPNALQRATGRVMGAPGARIMFGRSKPITRSGQVATTTGSAISDVQWTPVAGRSGWSTAPGEGGSTVFKGPAGQMFSAMPSDLAALGGLTGTIDYYMGVSSQSNTGTPIVDPSTLPQPSSETSGSAVQSPTAPYYGAGPTGGASSSGQSFTDPGSSSSIAPAPDPNPQVTQDASVPMPDAAPADSQTVHPLIAGAVAIGAGALLFLTKKH